MEDHENICNNLLIVYNVFMPKGIKGFVKGNQYGKNTAGENHGHWLGGFKHKRQRGTEYILIRIGVRKYQLYHRYLMEKKLGRKLSPKEVVHHIDGNTMNNIIENLELLNWGEHKRKHMGSYIYKDGFVCKCGNTKHCANGMCETCYSREYARRKYNYKKRLVFI